MPYPQSKAQPFEIVRERSALIVVDMQNDFVREGAPLEVPRARDTINQHNKLLLSAHAFGIPVVFTRFIAGPSYSLVWEWSPELGPETKCCWPGHVRKYLDRDKEIDAVEIIDELRREARDLIVDKYGYNAFFRTNLADHLESRSRDTVVVTGTVTQICVEDTVRGAFHHGYRTAVVSDAVSSFDEELHDASLRSMEMKYARVMDTDGILAAWEKGARR